MNRQWRNNPSNSAGFVYFDTNNSYQNQNTSDFMAFNDSTPYSSPKNIKFSPVHYSSPNKYQNNSRNFHGRNMGRRPQRYHDSRDSNSFNSSNRSFNSPNFNNSKRNSGNHTRSNNSFNAGKKDVSMYFDHTCLKDPWAELEQMLTQTQAAEVKADSSVAEKEALHLEESSSSSAEEQESESEVKTSSSELEDGTT